MPSSHVTEFNPIFYAEIPTDILTEIIFVTGRNCGQDNIFTPVCHSVHSRGCLPQCMLGYHTPSPGADTPRADTPREQTPPQSRHPPGADTPNSRHTP